MIQQYYTLENELKTSVFAQVLAQAYQENMDCNQRLVIYLQGDLGAGKSFLSRAFIQFFLPQQKVKSPTYTMVESYQTPLSTVHHFDLYRLGDPEELEYLAIRDLLTEPFVALVEWPQKGAGILPDADILIELQHTNETISETEKKLKTGPYTSFDARLITLSACSIGGGEILEGVARLMSRKR